MSRAEAPHPQGPRPGPKAPSRFGPTAIVREGPPSEDAHLIALFARETDAAGTERRQSPRFPTVVQCAWLGWWATPRQFTTIAARLDDISQGGARLAAADPPPVGQIVWLCLGVPEPTECVQAKVLAVTPTTGDVPVVRLAFGTPCPQNLYQVAIYGLAVQGEIGG